MKKYLTTDKHPDLKEGIELKNTISDNFVYCHIGSIEHGFNAKEEWLKKGWIKEIQEPKWTDDDMIDFSKFILKQIKTDLTYEPTDNEWIEKWEQSKS